MHPSYIVSLSSVLLKLIQFRLLYIVYAAGLGSETTSRKKKVLYNLLYKLLQLVLMCREIPLFQKTCWTNCSKGTHSKYTSLWGRNRHGFTEQTVHMPSIHPMRSTIYTSWKSTQLHIKYREDKIFALGSRDVNDYAATVILRQWSRRQRIPAQLEKGLRKHLIYRVNRLAV